MYNINQIFLSLGVASGSLYLVFSVIFVSGVKSNGVSHSQCHGSCECEKNIINIESVICWKASGSLTEMTSQLPTNTSSLSIRESNFTSIEGNSFDNFTNLRSLCLPNNGIEVIADDTFKTVGKTLTRLEVNSNKIKKLNKNIFRPFETLMTLNLENNELGDSDFASLAYLKILTLMMGKNSLESLDCDALLSMSNLERLSVPSNQIDTVTACTLAESLNNTIFLDLSQNLLSRVPLSILQRMPNLIILMLSNNRVQGSLEEMSSLKMQKLRYLSLENNQLSSLNKEDFSGMTNLQKLVISGNQLSAISPETFSYLTSLRYLHLSSMLTLDTIDENAFGGLLELHTLEVSFNPKLTLFPSSVNAPKLETLNMSYNGIMSFPEKLFSLPSLERAPIDGNRLLCDCKIKWMNIALNQIPTPTRWIPEWKESSMAPKCAKPGNMKGSKIENLRPEDFTCDPPIITTTTPQEMLLNEGDNITIEALMTHGFPSGRWIDPNGVVFYPGHTIQLPSSPEVNVQETVFSNGSVASYLTIWNIDERLMGTYTLVAENAASGASMTFNLTQIEGEFLLLMSNGEPEKLSNASSLDTSQTDNAKEMTSLSVPGVVAGVFLSIGLITLFIFSVYQTNSNKNCNNEQNNPLTVVYKGSSHGPLGQSSVYGTL